MTSPLSPSLSRRGLIAALGLAAASAPAWAAAETGPPLGRPAAFSFDRLKAAAAASALRPYAPPPPAPNLSDIDYDAVGQIAYRPGMSLWGGRADTAAIRFFPLSRYARRPVKIYAVEAGQARELLYSSGLFEAGNPALAKRLASFSGFAGFRAMNPDQQTDWLAFQGASYFRSADPFNQYGLSARGLAINTAVQGPESFPDFTAFWLERDPEGGLIIHARLEGEEVSGAYRIANRRIPAGLVQEIECALFFRKSVERLGVAPLTSMFWYGENGQSKTRDWRPEIHDSDGLAISTGAGERIWRPLIDPPRVLTNAFADLHPRGFGLLQRDRLFDHYQDDGVFYERRPSAWVEPIGDWGAGSVQLVEIPTDDETNDNIVAFWTPAEPVRAGDARTYRYRLTWTAEEPASGVARVVATRVGLGGKPGQPRPPGVKKLVVDFEGGGLTGLTRDSGVKPVVSISGGVVDNVAAYPIAGTSRWRLMLDVTPPESASSRFSRSAGLSQPRRRRADRNLDLSDFQQLKLASRTDYRSALLRRESAIFPIWFPGKTIQYSRWLITPPRLCVRSLWSKFLMNALALNTDVLRLRRGRDEALADLPPSAPLTMPVQALHQPLDSPSVLGASPTAFRLGGLVLATLLLTAAALVPVYQVLGADTIGPLDVLILALVTLLFAWSAFSFLSAAAGFFAGMRGETCELGLDTHEPAPPLTSRTAVLLPIYNEAPRPVFARLQAICESVEATGAGDHFDFFVLSDTTDPEIRAQEQGLFQGLKLRLGARTRVFYRHRPENHARKAGNIADWVRRFGGAYEHMVVLDADSLMEGETLVRLAAAMERSPDVGLIQTAPAIVNRHTLFARAEQFASRLYGPMLALGVAWWSGSEGNYWGHNAIIRVQAFAEHAGLPQLNGRKPFGGHILSHDFVEAALLRRAGWRVHMAPSLGGSYEESPPTLAALLARDRRWSQGNLQHIQVLYARGLHWVSRFHLLRGISAYLVAPLWLSLLACAVVLPLRPDWGRRPGSALPPLSQTADLTAVGLVFAVSIGFLLGPKVLAYIHMLCSPGEKRRFGGPGLAALNVVIETLLSTLIAPVIMVSHTCSLAAVVAGRDSGWVAQARDETRSTLGLTLRLHAVDTALGLLLAGCALASSARAFLWMTPVIAGLVFAIPLATAAASGRLGRAARRAGILLAPEERRLPQILARTKALSGGWPAASTQRGATSQAAGRAAEYAPAPAGS